MEGIVLSKAAQEGIKNVKKSRQETGENYQALVKEAGDRIEKARAQYAVAYKEASAYLAQ